jgi:hypothetical protein
MDFRRIPFFTLGRLYKDEVMFLVDAAQEAVHKKSNLYSIPQPDGHDPAPYWNTETIRQLLAKPPQRAPAPPTRNSRKKGRKRPR